MEIESTKKHIDAVNNNYIYADVVDLIYSLLPIMIGPKCNFVIFVNNIQIVRTDGRTVPQNVY